MNFSTDNIVTFIVSMITALLGYISCRLTLNKPYRFKLLEKQLYKVYLPLFRKMEFSLYKIISIETAKDYIDFFNNIKSSNYELIDSELCNLFWIFENSYNSNKLDLSTYSCICSRLDFLFESTRRKLYMPTRKLGYKVNRKQYPEHTIISMSYIIKYISRLCVLIILGLLFMYFTKGLSIVINSILSIIHH